MTSYRSSPPHHASCSRASCRKKDRIRVSSVQHMREEPQIASFSGCGVV